MADSDEALVQAAQKGDAAAFEELVRRTAKLVFAQLYLETGDTHEAEDLSQETFVSAFGRIRQLGDAKLFRPWLLKIAHSVLIDSIRRNQRLKRRRPIDPPGAAPPDDPLAAAARADECRQMLSLLRSMPAEYRQPLMLRYLADADYQTIGRELGISNGSLRGLLHRGLAMLRQQMQSRETEERQ